jgi:PAS domain S-box-containing protein
MNDAARASAVPSGLADNGSMAARLAAHDWSASPLGPRDAWPLALRTVIGIMLGARQPMFLAWGAAKILLYNDSYVPLLGAKHPGAFARPVFEVWREIEADIKPLMDQVWAGQSVHMDDIALVLERHGQPEEAHFAFSYTPVFEHPDSLDPGQVAGLFCACTETTAQVLTERRRNFRLALAEELRTLAEPRAIIAAAVNALGRYLGASRVGYGEVQPGARTFLLETTYTDQATPLIGQFELESFGAANIARQRLGQTVVHEDVMLDPASNPQAWAAIGTRAFVAVPLMREGRLAATLFVNDASPRRWSVDDVALIEHVASRTWDAVDRVRAEATLKRLNETLEQRVAERTLERDRVWRHSRDLLVVVGADGVYRDVNPAWTTILGHDPAQVIGRHFSDFVWPDDVQATRTALDEAASAKNLTDFSNRHRHADGTPRWIAWHTSVESGIVYAYGRDTTAARQQHAALAAAEEALRQSQKMEAVGQLTGGLAHDFNNLLTGITGSLDLLASREAAGRIAGSAELIATAQGAAARAAALTHRLLAFSRQQSLDPRPTDANRLIAGMEDLIRRTVGPQIAVTVSSDPQLWPILVDPNQLENALLNLCINARDAMKLGGRLTIETVCMSLDRDEAGERGLDPGDYVALRVLDTGIGMSSDIVRRAFDPFFTTKPAGQGTGLGLSMIYGFARQSGGTARILSAPGQGAAVCLYLPRHDAPEYPGAQASRPAPHAAPAAAASTASSGEHSVLVVDDEPTIRMLISEVLSDLGARAIEAEDGPTALPILQSDTRIDLLITDLGLPGGMNGLQIAEAGRLARPELKILFITGYAETTLLASGRQPADSHQLSKPFAMDRLASLITEILG